MNNDIGAPVTRTQENVKSTIPVGLLVCGMLLVVGVVLTLIGNTQERPLLFQIGLVCSGFGVFFGAIRISVWGSK